MTGTRTIRRGFLAFLACFAVAGAFAYWQARDQGLKEGIRSFRASMESAGRASCLASARESVAGQLSEAEIGRYCDCVSEKLAALPTDDEIRSGAEHQGAFIASLQSRMEPVAAACRAQ